MLNLWHKINNDIDEYGIKTYHKTRILIILIILYHLICWVGTNHYTRTSQGIATYNIDHFSLSKNKFGIPFTFTLVAKFRSLYILQYSFESQHAKTPSDVLPTKTQIRLCIHTVLSVLIFRIKKFLYSWLSKMCPLKILMTAPMCSLIQVFAGYTCRKVGYLILWLFCIFVQTGVWLLPLSNYFL